MTDDRELLRRQVLALGAANREMQAEIAALTGARRDGVAQPWIEALSSSTEQDGPPAALVVAEDGVVHLVDAGARRRVASGLLVELLEVELGPRRPAEERQLDAYVDGPPVEVLEGPDGPPFLIIGGRVRPVRGLPLTHPIGAVPDRFEIGEALDLGHLDRSPEPAAEARPTGPLPTFLIIGAQKSATRWLRANLGQHPDIYAAPSELEFFNNDDHFERQGVAWYRDQFGGWSGEPIVGEATPGYMMWRHQPAIMARRIAEVVPDVRLIAILRNPVDRTYSAFLHHAKRERIHPDADLLELVRNTPPESDFMGLIAGGWYAASLRPFVRRFGDQLLVLLHDDIDGDGTGVYARALSHVGADPGFVPPGLQKVRFSNQPAEASDDPLTPEARAELYEYFRDDVRELSELLGRDLSSWDPASATAEDTPGTEADAPTPDRADAACQGDLVRALGFSAMPLGNADPA